MMKYPPRYGYQLQTTRPALQDRAEDVALGNVDAVDWFLFAADNNLKEFQQCCLKFLMLKSSDVSLLPSLYKLHPELNLQTCYALYYSQDCMRILNCTTKLS